MVCCVVSPVPLLIAGVGNSVSNCLAKDPGAVKLVTKLGEGSKKVYGSPSAAAAKIFVSASEKNRRFFRIGPPTKNPGWTCLSGVRGKPIKFA